MLEPRPDVRIVLTTLDSAEKARELARQLIRQRLAACVNIVDHVHSVYRWGATSEDDSVESADEVLLIIKTAADRVEALQQALYALHPYELPEFLVLSVEAAEREYLRWMLSSSNASANPKEQA